MKTDDKDLPIAGRQGGALETEPSSLTNPAPPTTTETSFWDDTSWDDDPDVPDEHPYYAASETEAPFIRASHRVRLAEEQAARALAICNRPFTGDGEALTVDDMVVELREAFMADSDCETMLFMHSQVMDSLFSRLIAHGLIRASKRYYDPKDNYIDKDSLNLALRIQRQCRITVETLKEMTRKPEEPDMLEFFSDALTEGL